MFTEEVRSIFDNDESFYEEIQRCLDYDPAILELADVLEEIAKDEAIKEELLRLAYNEVNFVQMATEYIAERMDSE